MDNLWAPWRMKYVTLKRQRGCIFCRGYKETKDEKNYVIYRAQYSLVILNKFPYNNGHLLVAPCKHVSSLDKLNESQLLDLNKTVIRMISLLHRTLSPHGFNIGMNLGEVAGAGIKNHLHIHIVPRWQGDTNFMPICTNTKVIPQNLEALYKELKDNL